MKQRITVEQLNELTDEQKQRLRDWWKPQVGDFYAWHCIGIKTEGEHLATDNVGPWADEEAGQYAIPLLSTGEMIEILEPFMDNMRVDDDGWYVTIYSGRFQAKEYADALWEAVKSKLGVRQ